MIERLPRPRVDLLALIGADTMLRRKAATGGGEYCGPCPWCGGRDRFLVQPEQMRWRCRQCTERWHDAIAYLMRRDGLDFRQACAQLDGQPAASLPRPHPAPSLRSVPSSQWQQAAVAVIQQSRTLLWSDVGERARRWLEQRGLLAATIDRWQLGYSSGQCIERLWVPRGIVIPWMVDDTPWQLKVRRPLTAAQRAAGAAKYVSVSWRDPQERARRGGGHPHLYGADLLVRQPVLVLTEGEFDTMVLWQSARHRVDVASLGSACALPHDRSIWYLLPYARILLSYDMDRSGEQGVRRLSALSARMQRLPLPTGPWKDLSDFHQAGHALWPWLERFLGLPV